MNRAIALVDCNSFFCSCEKIFRPDLNGKPVIVLSNNDGCAVARTPEAKALGIKMGAPYFKIKDICKRNNVAVFSTNFVLYNNISDRVMGILERESPEIEVYSVDEAFLDLTGIEDLSVFGQRVRSRILKDVGIPTCVGIAPTKVLAKVANNIAKKSSKSDGVVNLMERRLQDIALGRTAIEDLWGVGAKSAIKMRGVGIKTALDFRDYKNEKLIRKVFSIVGLRLQYELQGLSCLNFNEPVTAKKEIMCSRTFGKTIIDKKSLKEAVSNYISNAAAKMRAQGSVCHHVMVFFRTNPYQDSKQSYVYADTKLMNPTCSTLKLIRIAEKLIDENFKPGYQYKKAGAKLSGFQSHGEFQIDLFGDSDTGCDIELMKCIDLINHREGEHTIKSMSCGISNKAWKMNRNYKSKRYTTSWRELFVFN